MQILAIKREDAACNVTDEISGLLDPRIRRPATDTCKHPRQATGNLPNGLLDCLHGALLNSIKNESKKTRITHTRLLLART